MLGDSAGGRMEHDASASIAIATIEYRARLDHRFSRSRVISVSPDRIPADDRGPADNPPDYLAASASARGCRAACRAIRARPDRVATRLPDPIAASRGSRPAA